MCIRDSVSGDEPAFVGFNFVFSPIVIFDLNKCFEREPVGAELITSIQAENPDRPTARNGENQFVFLFEKRRNVINQMCIRDSTCPGWQST